MLSVNVGFDLLNVLEASTCMCFSKLVEVKNVMTRYTFLVNMLLLFHRQDWSKT